MNAKPKRTDSGAVLLVIGLILLAFLPTKKVKDITLSKR